MATHGNFPRLIVLNGVAPRETGGNLDLGDGQIGLFENRSGSRGAIAVSSTQNSKNQDFFFEVGTGRQTNEGGTTTKGFRTVPFKPSEVEDVSFSYAKDPVASKVYLGYDGFDPTKTIDVGFGEEAQIHVRLTGEQAAFLGKKDGIIEESFMLKAKDETECQDSCLDSPCKDLVFRLVEQMKEREIATEVKLKDLLDIHPIASCHKNKDSVSEATFYNLELCDKGDNAALGKVQSQVTGSNVVRIDRYDTTSVYQVISTGDAPDDFVDYQRPVLVGCDDECPAGYTNIGDDFVYKVDVEDDGSDVDFSTLSYITTSTKVDQNRGIGTYVLTATVKLTQTNIDDLKSNYPTIAFDPNYYARQGLCIVDEQTTVSWTEDKTCGVTYQYYYIDLDDDDCGDSRLQELRDYYPDLEIYSADHANIGEFLSGDVDGDTVDNKVTQYLNDLPSGDCRNRYFARVTTDVLCDECHPDVWVSEAPDGFEFELWKKVDFGGGEIVAVTDSGCDTEYESGTYTGVTGTTDGDGSGAEFTVEIDADGCPTVTITNGGVNYSVDDTITIDPVDIGEPSGNPDNADDLVLTVTDILEPENNTNCKCGIMFRTKKDLYLCPDSRLHDEVAAITDQLEVQVSGGEVLGHKIGYEYYTDGEFPVTRVSRAFNGTSFGHEYWEQEKMSYEYFTGLIAGQNNAERFLKNMESKLDPCEQYDTATVKVKRTVPAGGFSSRTDTWIRYIFVFPSKVRNLVEDYFHQALPQ